jgi:hypothetical protein
VSHSVEASAQAKVTAAPFCSAVFAGELPTADSVSRRGAGAAGALSESEKNYLNNSRGKYQQQQATHV